MPQPKNRFLRTVIPIAAVIAGLGLVISVLNNTANQKSASPTPPGPGPAQTAPAVASTPPTPESTTPETTPKTTPETPPRPITPSPAPAQPEAAPATAPAGLLDGLHAEVFPATTAAPTPLGSLDPKSDARYEVQFTPSGAGIASLRLSRHFESIKKLTHIQIQAEHSLEVGDSIVSCAPFAATFAQVGLAGSTTPPITVNLYSDRAGPIWRQVAPDRPGVFEAQIVNSAGTPILRIERAYRFHPQQHDLLLDQKFTNLTPAPLTIQFTQFGPVDPPNDSAGYGGDKRRVRFGYLLKPAADPARQTVLSSDFVIPRDTELGPVGKTTGVYDASRQSWPRPESTEKGYELVWAGLTNRYFGVAVFPQIDLSRNPPDKPLREVAQINRLVLDPGHASRTDRREVMALSLVSQPITIAAGAAADYNLGIFAGPLAKKDIKDDPLTRAAGLDGLVVYNFGGPCGPCTFDFLTGFLVWLLHTLHDCVVFDWALAIIVLVVCVRSLLHPVTRWSQIRMQRFSKQMQSIQPKQKKLQEKYKDDRTKLQQETAKLWKEEGISPTGMLGCIPMFLQTPVWIALYATLYFAVELRHQPAFFGVFQAISPTWSFLGDLAEADRLIYLGKTYHLPLLSSMFGPVDSINILPLILGFVFFVHQKYLTPPMQNLTPEQESQQKMIKWMSVLMFPVFMYNAPSGLALYFIANSTLGIFENMWIRKDIEKHGLADPDKMRAQRQAKAAARGEAATSGGGWFKRMQQLAEAQRAAAEKRARQAQKGR
ncbi:MAG: YidC/Oxa1 family insertase periplasmic-domain containing protein [Phycisphaerales bacterium]|nr:YidC/Oxa1 family insertase periplasmic-domain containing protein [Phycisphaerales bacterium]